MKKHIIFSVCALIACAEQNISASYREPASYRKTEAPSTKPKTFFAEDPEMKRLAELKKTPPKKDGFLESNPLHGTTKPTTKKISDSEAALSPDIKKFFNDTFFDSLYKKLGTKTTLLYTHQADALKNIGDLLGSKIKITDTIENTTNIILQDLDSLLKAIATKSHDNISANDIDQTRINTFLARIAKTYHFPEKYELVVTGLNLTSVKDLIDHTVATSLQVLKDLNIKSSIDDSFDLLF